MTRQHQIVPVLLEDPTSHTIETAPTVCVVCEEKNPDPESTCPAEGA